MTKSFKLNDNTISHIAQLVQVAILTGTDIIDHMRMIELTATDEDLLVLDNNYEERFSNVINDMLNNVNKEALSSEG